MKNWKEEKGERDRSIPTQLNATPKMNVVFGWEEADREREIENQKCVGSMSIQQMALDIYFNWARFNCYLWAKPILIISFYYFTSQKHSYGK